MDYSGLNIRSDMEKAGFLCVEFSHSIAIYSLDPAKGNGTCCFYNFRNLFALIQANCAFYKDAAAGFSLPHCLLFWLDEGGALRCHTSIGEEHILRVSAKTSLSTTAMVLSPGFYAECLRLLPEGAAPKLDRALQLLDGGILIPEVVGLMHQIEAMSPIRSGAGLFYEAKVKELLSYVLRWYEDSDRETAVSSDDRQAVIDVMRHLGENLAEPLSIEACTRVACMGKSKLSDLFRRINGRSLSDYFLSLRMERAKALLLNSTRAIGDIAKQVGYQKQTSFSTAFKEYTGVPPNDYRKRLSYDYNAESPTA